MPYAREVVNDLRYRAEVARSALGEQTQVVEKVEGCCRRLMNAGNDDELRELSKVSFPTSLVLQSNALCLFSPEVFARYLSVKIPLRSWHVNQDL